MFFFDLQVLSHGILSSVFIAMGIILTTNLTKHTLKDSKNVLKSKKIKYVVLITIINYAKTVKIKLFNSSETIYFPRE